MRQWVTKRIVESQLETIKLGHDENIPRDTGDAATSLRKPRRAVTTPAPWSHCHVGLAGYLC